VTPTAGRLLAITHVPSPHLAGGERTYVGHEPIDAALALRQHAGYCEALRQCGAEVVTLDLYREHPDCVFVEDTAIVLDEIAVLMSMGAPSRRGEVAGIEAALAGHRPLERIRLPATIDGGDVVRSGRSLYVGASARTNAAGIDALRDVVGAFGYGVTAVPVRECLHLKSACSALPDGRFLVNSKWIDTSPLPKESTIEVPEREPWAGDVLVVDEAIVLSDAFPETANLLGRDGTRVIPVSVSEFAKAEGGVTCMSLVFRTAHTSLAARALGPGELFAE
jgi:dimethylargininase